MVKAPWFSRAPDHQVGVLNLRRLQHVDPGPVAFVGQHVGLGPDHFQAIGILVDRDDLVLPGQRVGHAATHLSDADDDNFHSGPSFVSRTTWNEAFRTREAWLRLSRGRPFSLMAERWPL
jgi:hypothetical protein